MGTTRCRNYATGLRTTTLQHASVRSSEIDFWFHDQYILSPDDCFVTRTRQTVMTAKRYAECLDILKAENPEERMDDEMRARYTRNRTLIDLREVPDDLIIDIFAAYESEEARQREVGAYTRYLTSHGIL